MYWSAQIWDNLDPTHVLTLLRPWTTPYLRQATYLPITYSCVLLQVTPASYYFKKNQKLKPENLKLPCICNRHLTNSRSLLFTILQNVLCLHAKMAAVVIQNDMTTTVYVLIRFMVKIVNCHLVSWIFFFHKVLLWFYCLQALKKRKLLFEF